MAQSKLNEYFTSKKRTDSAHASKRRKIEIPFSNARTRSKSDDGQKSPATNPLVPSDSEWDVEQESVPVPPTLIKLSLPKRVSSLTKSLRSKNKTGTKSAFSRNRNKTKAASSVKPDTGQIKLTELIKATSSKEADSGVQINSDVQANSGRDEERQTAIVEEATSFWDSHVDSQQSTPRKRNISPATAVEPLTRRRRTPDRRQSPNKTEDLSATTDSARKKLELDPLPEAGTSKDQSGDESVDETDNEVSDVMMGKTHLLSLVSEIILPLDDVISPLPATPERLEEGSSSPEQVVAISPKLQNLSQKIKALSKMNGQALKNRLKQSGKISEIKEKADALNKAISQAKVQPVSEVKIHARTEVKRLEAVSEDKVQARTEANKLEAVTENKVQATTKDKVEPLTGEVAAKGDARTEESDKLLPAYQRFDHLVEEGPPTLSLPFSYKLLEGSFQAMDTVVSMMHNRSEMCTFSKLRAAVQNMTKKNFEEKTVGQIKTIAPEAYTFRQENSVPSFGNKVSGYQLTIEANLQQLVKKSYSEGAKTNEGKSTFTASMLVKRKHSFRNGLVGYVKQLHKAFLATLKPPMSIPDEKLTRWHPHFQLDKVPEVAASPLPQPPEMRVYHSAKDVLEKQRGRLNPRVEEALSKISAVAEDGTNNRQQDVSPSPIISSAPDTPSMKGIPPALLAKIRAKEAQRMEEALTRNPAEDHKTKIMTHLPEVIRILRTYFVTEKKPALPLEAVYKKLEDSYHTGISQRDMEQHIEMLKELAPELISVVEIRRGKFIKLDKNVDIQAVSNRILNLVKSRK